MARVSPITTNFTAGELSPQLEGRVDFNKYFNGLSEFLNFTAKPHGGAVRRSGFRHVAAVKTAGQATRLIPFEFSTVQAYVIEMGDQYMRFYRNEGQIVDGGAVEVATPYLEAELFDVQFAQSADVLYLVHPNHEPRKLERTSHTSWTLSVIDFTDGPYRDDNTTATTLNPSAATGTGITITASAVTGINGGDGFKITDVGRLVALEHSGTWGYAKITGFTSTTVVTADVVNDFNGATAVTTWRLGTWSDTTGWPATVTFYEQRLMFAGATDFPQRIDGSKIGDFENFTPGTNDDDPISYTLAAGEVNAIRWINAGQVLLIGTVGGEWIMRSTTAGDPLTPTNVNVRRQTTYGSAAIRPLRIGNAVLFMQRAGRKLRELVYQFETDAYVAPDLTLLAEHVSEGGITDIAYQQEPDSVVWCVRTDGTLLGLTYDRPQDVVGWHRHIVGGSFGGGQAVVESVAAIPNPAGTADQLWIVVKRTVGGATVRYIEFMEDGFDGSTVAEDAFFVDSGLTYSGAAATVMSGLDHLEGETVSVLADGAVVPDKVVASGQITLPDPATKVHAGLAFTSRLKTMRIEAGAQDGTAQGKTKRIHRATVRLFRTLGLKIGTDPAKLDTVPFRTGADTMDSAPPLFTGDKRVALRGGWNTEGRVVIQQDQPLPMHVIALMPQLQTNDL